jgi:3-hydroxybutyryl-CoA dehydrogenase
MQTTPSQPIQTIAILGAGTMGRGIAHVAALAGYDTHLFDISTEVTHQARQSISKNLAKGVDLGKIDTEAAKSAEANLHYSSDLSETTRSADLVIEAAPENVALKIKLLNEVITTVGEHTLIASNTSGLSITEMAAATDRPTAFAGMHFFNPVHIMRLIEIVRGLETSDKTIKTLTDVALRMKKEVVVVNESPGFITSRMNALIGNEAFRMLQEGVASAEDIDKALKLGLNHPMGPFEMVDLVGLDVRLSILQHLNQTLGDLYRPSPLLLQFVKAGRLGRKAGRGIYRYDSQGLRISD